MRSRWLYSVQLCAFVRAISACAIATSPEDGDPHCIERWRLDLSGVGVSRVGYDPAGVMFVAGVEGQTGVLAAIDACSGAQTGHASLTMTDAATTDAQLLTVAGDDVYVGGSVVVGSGPAKAMYAHLTRPALEIDGVYTIAGSSGEDELWGLAAGPSGALWFAGITDALVAPSAWGVKASATGQSCGFAGLTMKASKSVVVSGNAVYVAAQDQDDQLRLLRYDDGACSTTSPCPCQPTFTSSSISIGTSFSDVRQLVVVGGRAYLAGYAGDTNAGADDYFGFVAQVDVATGVLLATYRWNPTSMFDGFSTIATDGEMLYVAGTQGYDGTTFIHATLQAIPVAFQGSVSARVTVLPSDVTVLWGIESDPGTAGSLYVDGSREGTGNSTVLKCPKSGDCL